MLVARRRRRQSPLATNSLELQRGGNPNYSDEILVSRKLHIHIQLGQPEVATKLHPADMIIHRRNSGFIQPLSIEYQQQ